jgi:hypothetical protein
VTAVAGFAVHGGLEAGMHAHRCSSRMREHRSRWHKNGHDARGRWTMDGDGIEGDHNTYGNSTIIRFGRRIERKEGKGKGDFEGHVELDPIGSKGHWIRGC